MKRKEMVLKISEYLCFYRPRLEYGGRISKDDSEWIAKEVLQICESAGMKPPEREVTQFVGVTGSGMNFKSSDFIGYENSWEPD